MVDVIVDTIVDSVKLLPFLFITYLVLEFIEHKSSFDAQKLVSRSESMGPIIGAAIGVVPQCGFSTSASNLYAQRLISAGTLLAVFLSTSDEMLPVLISESVSLGIIVKILLVKVIAAAAVGLLVDRVFKIFSSERGTIDLHSMCEREHCHCEDHGIFYSALIHTLQIAVFILIISFALNVLIYYIGEDNLARLILNRPVIGPLISAIVGLIPNCASSVIITELYLSGAMSTGAMLSGLLAASGVGVLVLFRVNKEHMRDNLKLLGILYLSGVVIGIAFDLVGITF